MFFENSVSPQIRVDNVLKDLLSDETSQTEAALSAVRTQKHLREEIDKLRNEREGLTSEIHKLESERKDLLNEMLLLRKKSSYYAKGVYGIFNKMLRKNKSNRQSIRNLQPSSDENIILNDNLITDQLEVECWADEEA